MRHKQEGEQKGNRVFRINSRLTEQENKAYLKAFKASGFKKKSSFIRTQLLSKNGITYLINQKNIQKIILETAKLRTDLIKVGTNFNQLMTAINTFKKVQISDKDFQTIEYIDVKLDEVMELFKSLSDLSTHLERPDDINSFNDY